jgi:chromosome segregation ATPase
MIPYSDMTDEELLDWTKFGDEHDVSGWDELTTRFKAKCQEVEDFKLRNDGLSALSNELRSELSSLTKKEATYVLAISESEQALRESKLELAKAQKERDEAYAAIASSSLPPND